MVAILATAIGITIIALAILVVGSIFFRRRRRAAKRRAIEEQEIFQSLPPYNMNPQPYSMPQVPTAVAAPHGADRYGHSVYNTGPPYNHAPSAGPYQPPRQGLPY